MRAAAALILLSAPAWAGAESAVWTPRELSFVYLGFTAQYSCDGLRDRLTDVLLRLGARPDLEVRESACTSIGSPDAFPGVRIKMNVLQPSAGEGAAAVPAHWKHVDLTSGRGALAADECELLEQVRAKILPLFATRNVEYSSNCPPHQLQLAAAWLRAEVLVADANPAGGLNTGNSGPAPGP